MRRWHRRSVVTCYRDRSDTAKVFCPIKGGLISNLNLRGNWKRKKIENNTAKINVSVENPQIEQSPGYDVA